MSATDDYMLGDHVLAFNAGSSSLKFELFRHRPVWSSQLRGNVENIAEPRCRLVLEGSPKESCELATAADAARFVLRRLDAAPGLSRERLAAVAHRIVHGGAGFTDPVVVDAQVGAKLRALAPLAPLHNPAALNVLEVARAAFAGVPAIAVFDTAFFATLPEIARRYAVPEGWHAAGVRRYGFHGIAHAELGARSGELWGRGARRAGPPPRLVTLQLGHGCSVSALEHGRPVDTSMGFTPLEGLIMGTRPGDLDPGVLPYLVRAGHDWQSLERALNHESGLLGLSGVTGDVRELLALETSGHAGAALALGAFCLRARKYLGAYAAVLGGLDVVAFGGGIGQHAPQIRERILSGLEWLGLELDREANDACAGERAQRISAAASKIEVWVIPVEEQAALAHAALECLDRSVAAGNQSVPQRSD